MEGVRGKQLGLSWHVGGAGPARLQQALDVLAWWVGQQSKGLAFLAGTGVYQQGSTTNSSNSSSGGGHRAAAEQ